MKIKCLNVSEARAIYEAGFVSIKVISSAKSIHIYKALQRAFVPEKQYSTNIDHYLFKPTTEISCASVNKAELVIQQAKAIMKTRRMQETIQQKRQRIEWFKKQKELREKELNEKYNKAN